MKFLANENFPLKSVVYLRMKGFDVKSVGVELTGITDVSVMETSIKEDRIILTFDKDYGELVFRYGYRPEAGIIIFKLLQDAPDEPGRILEEVIENADITFSKFLTVIDKDHIRQKPFP